MAEDRLCLSAGASEIPEIKYNKIIAKFMFPRQRRVAVPDAFAVGTVADANSKTSK
jgi:hypothetical protein